MKGGKYFFEGIILLLLIIPFGMAADFNHVISNSEDWKDVFSTIHYSNLQNIENDFLTSTNHGRILLGSINKNKNIQVISSKNSPYVFNYQGLILGEGFAGATEIEVSNANLELINKLPDIQNFIIVDDSYGYNSIAVVPYAIKTNSWIFLANNLNIDQIDSILSQRNINEIMIYGYVDREVRDTLEKYSPEIIDSGDKFQNNIEITKKYLAQSETKQILLTNGDFIEKELMLGKGPILFTGRENVPDQIRDYIKNSDIEVGVLIGNELMGAATNIRRSTGISVMVKFARGARSAGDGISAVEGLDLFPLPTPSLIMGIDSIKYNTLTKQLEITYKSEANVPLYFKGTITLIDGDNNPKVGDLDPIFLTPGSYKTITYSIELNGFDNLKADIYTLFGETQTALDRILEARLDIETIDVLDNCEIEIEKIKYNKQSKEFSVYVKNTGPSDCWINIELENLQIGYEKKTIGTEGSSKILKGKSSKIKISEILTEEDLQKNAFVEITANYGERENSLVKTIKGKFELKIELLTNMTYTIIILIVIALILIFLFLKRRKEEEEEGY